jgi:predicted alpha/beta-fold hydrolase
VVELDEAYTRRVLGFESVGDMYRWICCEDLLNQIDDLPTLIVNALDDPCVLEESHAIPRAFAGMVIRRCNS